LKIFKSLSPATDCVWSIGSKHKNQQIKLALWLHRKQHTYIVS